MRFVITKRFEEAYRALPKTLQGKTNKALQFLSDNPAHPSLRLKKIKGIYNIWEARIDKSCRMTLEVHPDYYLLRNIGKHDETLGNP